MKKGEGAASCSSTGNSSRRRSSCASMTSSKFEETDQEDEERARKLAQIALVDIEKLPPRVVVPTERRARWNSRNIVPMSPLQVIDGKIVRSALLLNRFRRKKRKIRFKEQLVAGALEPENPWKCRTDLKKDPIIAAYKEACAKHKASPYQSIIYQIKSAENMDDRCEELNFEGVTLYVQDCEALEEIFRRVLFRKVDLSSSIGHDAAAEALFQQFEYYEPVTHLDLSNNTYIGYYGWVACSRMLRKTRSLKRLDANNVRLKDDYMTVLMRGFRYAYLNVLSISSSKLNGKLLELLVTALKFNMALRELYLCDNQIQGTFDSCQLETLLKFNSRLRYLDLSDNRIQDEDLYYIVNGLTHQLHFGLYSKSKRGLETLVLDNNKLTRRASTHINAAIKGSKTLECLSLAGMPLQDDTIMDIRESLLANRQLSRLILENTEITDFGAEELARILKNNDVIEALDLQNNPIYKPGLLSLVEAMEHNKRITEIHVDEKPKVKTVTKIKIKYSELYRQIQSLCEKNAELIKLETALIEAEADESEDSDENSQLFGGDDDLNDLEKQQDQLPSEYKRFANWKV
ncbi:hypothetical protein TKK_0017059 [Trichogramma kaykai]|uniref:Uncharacterized protein n=1 Tax=Trichogramma kaykai TaxID=54128 RepID=A0ABD2W4C7_9HYME